jgi:hypothetical protein
LKLVLVTLVMVDAAGEETEMGQPEGGDFCWSSLHDTDIWHDFACLATLNGEQLHEYCDTQELNRVEKRKRNHYWHGDQLILMGCWCTLM